MKILLAIDGSQCSIAAVREVAQSRWPIGSVVKVLSVIEPLVVPVPEAVVMPESCYDVMEMEAHAEVDRAIKAIKKATPSLKVESKVCLGKAEEVILEEGERRNQQFWIGSRFHNPVCLNRCTRLGRGLALSPRGDLTNR